MRESSKVIAQEIYRETKAFYDDRAQDLGDADCGFKILYGPPVHKPPILFIGYQPGGSQKDKNNSEHLKWPEHCEYAVAQWLLAEKLREVWPQEYLAKCTGLNGFFFRAQNAQTWRRLPLKLRKDLEKFCTEKAHTLIKAIEPRQIVFIGMNTFNQFAGSASKCLKGPNSKRILIREGSFCGIPACGVLHLSGARIQTAHRKEIYDYLRFIS